MKHRKTATEKRAQTRKNKRLRKTAIQFSEYMVAGGVWFWSGYILIVLLDEPLGLFTANFVGNAVGITLNFLLARYWVFRTKKASKLGVATWRYVVYTALNAFLLNYLILFSLRRYIGIDPAIGQFIASGFFTFWNYFWYKHWVFKGRERLRRTRHHA